MIGFPPEPKEQPKPRPYKSRVKSYHDAAGWIMFGNWLRERCNIPTRQLARALGKGYRDGASYVRKLFQGKVRPAPGTVKKLCVALGINWPSAFMAAGYYEELFVMLEDLRWLGEQWCAEDKVHPWGDYRWEFRSTGVLKINGTFVRELLSTAHFQQRYHIGTYIEDNTPPDPVPEQFKLFYSMPQRSDSVVLPKPTAASIFIATSGFPRRGDVYKDGSSTYAANLLEEVTPLIDRARQSRPTQRRHGRIALSPLLASACAAFEDDSVSVGNRRIISSEYVVDWADQLCTPYTYYARLAAYAVWGEGGSSVSTITPYTQMPQIRVANLPNPALFLRSALV